jgi:hypothetical protein
MWETIDPTALAIALAVFAVAVAVTWLIKRLAITDGLGLIVLVALPAVAYGVASGYVERISLPGGWAAEFRDIAAARIEPAPLIDAVDDLQIIEKGGIGALRGHIEALRPGQPIAVSLTLRRTNYYSARAIEAYIRAFQAFDPNLTVIFVERDNGRFVASSNGHSVLAAVDAEEGGGSAFVDAIEAGDVLALRRMVVLTTNTVDERTTNAEALRLMLRDGVDTMVKTAPNGRPVGIVRRDVIISRLIVQLAG